MRRAWRDLPLWRKTGIKIRETRKWRGLTESQVAEKLGMELKLYKRLEKGKTEDLTLKEVDKMIKLFRCQVEEILPLLYLGR